MNQNNNIFIRYWYLWLIVVLAPLLLYWFIQQPCGLNAIGGENAPSLWLGFWGGYLGAIISASVAFIILNKQLSQNRILIQKQTELQRLNDQRKAFAEYMASTNCNKFVDPLNTLFKDPDIAFKLTKQMIDEEYLPYMTIKLLLEDNEPCISLYEDIRKWRDCYTFAAKNLHTSSRLIIESKLNNTKLRESIEKTNDYSGERFRNFIIGAPTDDGSDKAYEKRVVEAHKKDFEAIKPLQSKMIERMHRYILHKETLINSL